MATCYVCSNVSESKIPLLTVDDIRGVLFLCLKCAQNANSREERQIERPGYVMCPLQPAYICGWCDRILWHFQSRGLWRLTADGQIKKCCDTCTKHLI